MQHPLAPPIASIIKGLRDRLDLGRQASQNQTVELNLGPGIVDVDADEPSLLVHTGRAYGYLSIGDTSRALSELEAGLDQGELVPQHILFVEPVLDGVRHSARFAAIVRSGSTRARSPSRSGERLAR